MSDTPQDESPPAFSPPAGMPDSPPPKIPSTLPHTLGLWNIIIASLSLLMAMCCGFYAISLAVQGNMGASMQVAFQQAQQEAQEKIQAELDEIDEQIAKAENDEDRDKLKKQRDTKAKMPPPAIPDMSGMFQTFSSRSVTAFSFTEVLTGTLLNGMLLAAGIGLVNRRPWSVKLSWWTAVLKLARLWVLYPLFVFWLLPGWIREFVAGMTQMIQTSAPSGQSMPPEKLQEMQTLLGSVYLGMGSAAGIAMILFGTIYPAILLWMLRKPEVQAACQGPTTLTP